MDILTFKTVLARFETLGCEPSDNSIFTADVLLLIASSLVAGLLKAARSWSAVSCYLFVYGKLLVIVML